MDATRLPIDQHVLGYWGFDEANVSDPALDETSYARNLAVNGASAVIAARLGNGRQFDGVATTAVLANPAGVGSFRQYLALTVICWVSLDSVLQTGSKTRTILAFDGDGGLTGRALYDLYVSNDGSLSYEHQSNAGETVRFQTAPGTLKTGRYYSLALTRDTRVFNMDDDGIGRVYPVLTLWLNNVAVPWANITVGDVPAADLTNIPLPASLAYATTSTLKVGHSGRRPDGFWHGIVDELSLHQVARPKQPYLDAAYYRITLPSAFNKLTAHDDIRTVGGVEMGGGMRWWCYERGGSLYVIRENSLGFYEKEVRLTTTGNSPVDVNQPVAWLRPGGTERPKLAYDPRTDSLIVAFLAGGRVYKITADSRDKPATVAAPSEDESTTIAKTANNLDGVRAIVGEFAPGGDRLVGAATVGDGVPVPSGLTFVDDPSFGLKVDVASTYVGIVIYRNIGDVETPIARFDAPNLTYRGTKVFFLPLGNGERVLGARYRVAAVTKNGGIGRTRSAYVSDWLGQLRTRTIVDGVDALIWNRSGDYAPSETFTVNAGESVTRPGLITVTRTPIKESLLDGFVPAAGESMTRPLPIVVTRLPIKESLIDTFTGAAVGESVFLRINSTNRAGVSL